MSYDDLAILVCVIAGALLVRNYCVWRVRDRFIDDDDLWPFWYDKLPDYDAMLLAPQFWHMWTKAQWAKWVKEAA